MIRIDKNKTTVVELSNNEIDLIENLLFDHRLEHLKKQNWGYANQINGTLDKFQKTLGQ
tara:strand:+ start:7087 stop:7263 length:177 start_codon:yes stop_codon:yes gene_type:complete